MELIIKVLKVMERPQVKWGVDGKYFKLIKRTEKTINKQMTVVKS